MDSPPARAALCGTVFGMIPQADDLPDVHTGTELTARWRQLLEPLVFDRRSLWLGWWSADGRQAPLLMPIDDLPAEPDPELIRSFWGVLTQTLDEFTPDGHAGMVLTRPGLPGPTVGDQRWATALADTAPSDPPISWSLHVAAAEELVALQVPDRL